MPEFLTNNSIKSLIAGTSEKKEVSDTQIRGLQLRFRGVNAEWSVRCTLHGKPRRYDLGLACVGDDGGGAIGIKTARARAFKVKEMCGAGMPAGRQIEAWNIGTTTEKVEQAEADKPKASWTWEAATKEFNDFNLVNRRKDTADDYEQKLNDTPEMQVFRGRMVNTITRHELMEAVARINKRGVWSTACGVRRVLSRFFNWLAEAERQNLTHVSENLMLNTKDPEKPRAEIGMNDHKRTSDYDDDAEHGDAPPPIELGRALVIARSDVLKESTALGIQLLMGTVQRRRAVLTATRWRFKAFPDLQEQLWSVPPYFRKSGSKRGCTFHLVPCVSWCAGAVDRLDRLIGDGKNPFLFPAVHARKPGDTENHHADIETLNRALESMPGVDFGPHGARYGFSTYGERDLWFAKSEGKLVLDHMEGTDAKDVTGQFYSSDPAIARKREMLQLWTAWLDKWAALAIEADPLLLDHDHLAEMVYRKKHGKQADEKLAIRIKFREARGWPMWGANGKQEAAE